MANSYVVYPCDGTVEVFSITFPYLKRAHIEVFVDADEDLSFTWETDSTIRLSEMPASGAVITIKRVTPSASRSSDFVDSALLDEETLDASMNELFYIMQEAVENVEDSMAFNRVTNAYDAVGYRITDVANPVDPQDVVTKNHFDTVYIPQITADKATVAAAKAVVIADMAIVAADKATVAADRGIVATDKATVATNMATVGTSKDAAVAAKVAAEAARDISLTVQATVIGEGDTQNVRVIAQGNTQDTRVTNQGTTQEGRVIAQGDTQSARVIAQGDTQDTRVIAEGDTQEIRVSSLVPGKNLIINGNFDIWQRGTSQGVAGYGSDDRWFNGDLGSTKVHTRMLFAPGQTDVPNNPQYYSRTVVSAAAGTTDLVTKQQRVESVATLSGGYATLSFWAKSDAPRNLAVEFSQTFGASGSSSVNQIGSQLVPLTMSWEKKTITVALPSVAGKAVGAGDYLLLLFWLDSGSAYDDRTASIGHQSGTFDIAQVQLEKGSVATGFDQRTYGEELALCQRYYEDVGGVLADSILYNLNTFYFKVTKRAVCSIGVPRIQSGTGAAFTATTWEGRGAAYIYQSAANTIKANFAVGVDAEL